MKCVKDIEQGLLLGSFGRGSGGVLALGVVTFFDLDAPEEPLSEQELWPFLQERLGQDAVFDQGMPKPEAELLVVGDCHAPDAQPVQALDITVKVGTIRKSLAVFGDRYWTGPTGMERITAPEAFTTMPTGWSSAYGGPDFPDNPQGKGRAPVVLPDGRQAVPLPNVETPGRLIGAPTDQPEPANLGPIDLTSPRRMTKAGTYDEAYMREHWPYYPADMDWTFFNQAADDQRMKDWFAGDETIAVANMHPARPLLRSRLPGLRQRVFLEMLDDPRDFDNAPTTFREVTTRAETLWLFPNQARGVLIHRGAAEIPEDEPVHVKRIFIATERLTDEPKSIEHYHDELRTRTNLAVPVDAAPLIDAKKQMDAAMDAIKDVPARIIDGFDQGLGKKPTVRRSPREIAVKAMAVLDQGAGQFAEGEKSMLDLRAKFGHLSKIDTDGFRHGAEQMRSLKKSIAKAASRAEKVQASATKRVGAMREQLLADLEKSSAASGRDLKTDPAVQEILAAMEQSATDAPPTWSDASLRFADGCRDRLLADAERIGELRRLGLRAFAVERGWFGINPEEARFPAADWGLDPDDVEDGEIVVPPGFIIPHFLEAECFALRVRPLPEDRPFLDAVLDDSADTLVLGSRDGAHLIGGHEEEQPVVIVADDLQARLVQQEAADLVHVAVLRDPALAADDARIAQAPLVLVALGTDVSADPWLAALPGAMPLPIPQGRTVFDLRAARLTIRGWLLPHLPPEHLPEGAQADDFEDEPADDQPLGPPTKLPIPDVPALLALLRKKVDAHMAPLQANANARRDALLDRIETDLRRHRPDQADDLMRDMRNPSQAARPLRETIDEAKSRMREQLAKAKSTMRASGVGDDAAEMRKLAKAEKTWTRTLDRQLALVESKSAELEKVKKGEHFPDWAKKEFARIGVDPNNPGPLTREDVVARHQAGESLARLGLAGLDLSELDLAGADLTGADCKGVVFTDANLAGVRCDQAILQEADFSGANLEGASITAAICMGAVFTGARCHGAHFGKSILSEADLSGVDLAGTTLDMALLEKTKLAGARFTGASLVSARILKADATAADFSAAVLDKALIHESVFDRAVFSGARCFQTQFITCTGEQARFTDADLAECRFMVRSSFPRADFGGCPLARSCFMEADMTECTFVGADMTRAMIDKSDFSGADLSRVTARHSRFVRSLFHGASLRGADLMAGSLRKSELQQADLRGANCYGVELYRTTVGQTRIEDANLKLTHLAGREYLLKEDGS
jgi:uncharacterized protein YjbI with pentapeptide repeats